MFQTNCMDSQSMGSELPHKERRQSHRKIQWNTSTKKITNKQFEELLHVSGFPAQYYLLLSSRPVVWSTIILHFLRRKLLDLSSGKGGTNGLMLVSAWCREVPQPYAGIYTVLAPSDSPNDFPSKTQGAHWLWGWELCVHLPGGGLRTYVCEGCRAEALLTWCLAEPTFFWIEKFENFLCNHSMTAPNLFLGDEEWILLTAFLFLFLNLAQDISNKKHFSEMICRIRVGIGGWRRKMTK